MEDIVNKVCSRLVSNPHVIGIIENCDGIDDIVDETNNLTVDFCIVSKEAGNQKIIYTEDGYTVCLRWRTEEQFLELVQKNPAKCKTKKILYDRIGLIKTTFSNFVV